MPKIKEKQIKPIKVICPNCNGKGKILIDSDKPYVCDMCEGRKYIMAKPFV